MQKQPSSTSKPTSKNKKSYEELGRVVSAVYETGYLDTAKSYRMSVIKGFLQGLGGVIGATLGIALLLWILTLFGEVPFIGDLADPVREAIDQPKE